MTLAHLFNRRQGGNEKSETYGEIINCTSDYRVKNLLALAMRSDNESQKQFQRWVNQKYNLLPSITESFQIMSRQAIDMREDLIVKVLNA
ncbi:MAG: hypothetical protein IPG39_12175 [Bacteroidetes bacterium]|nr:hypothetical protein [Bacteroidota bacterium]